MKEILISIQPQWVEKILNGEKTLEIRKTMPKCELPVKVYIYCTKAIKFKDVYLHELKKDDNRWIIDGTGYSYNNLNLFNHLFQFIKWEDEEPYNIEELLEEYENQRSE